MGEPSGERRLSTFIIDIDKNCKIDKSGRRFGSADDNFEGTPIASSLREIQVLACGMAPSLAYTKPDHCRRKSNGTLS